MPGAAAVAYLAGTAVLTVAAEFLPLPAAWRHIAYLLGRPPTILLVVAGLTVAACLADPARDLRREPLTRWAGSCPVWGWAAGYAVVLSVVSIRKHGWLDSYGCDLGIFENVLWNTLQGDVLYSSILGRHFFGEHVSPILLLLVPAYGIWQDPRLLLIVQSAAIGLGAVPLYWIAVRRLGRPAALSFVLVYLTYKPILRANLFDFHEIALAVPLLFFALYFHEVGRRGASLLMLALAVACKEEVCLIAAAFGVLLMLRGDRRSGLLVALGGVAIFLFETGIVVPWFRGAAFPFIDRYSHLGKDLPEVLTTLVTRPGFVLATTLTPAKMGYLMALVGPLAFLPLLGGGALVIVAPALARNLLSNQPAQYSLDLHFAAPAVPLLFYAAILGFERASRMLVAVASGSVGRGCLPVPGCLAAVIGSPRLSIADPRHVRWLLVLLVVAFGLGLGWTPVRALRDLPHDEGPAILRQVLGHVPPQASLAAHNTIVPHVARRPRLSVYPRIDDASYVALRIRPQVPEYPLQPDEERRLLATLVAGGQYAPVAVQGEFILLKRGRGASDAEIASVMTSTVLTREAEDLPLAPHETVVDIRASRGRAARIHAPAEASLGPAFHPAVLRMTTFLPAGPYVFWFDAKPGDNRLRISPRVGIRGVGAKDRVLRIAGEGRVELGTAAGGSYRRVAVPFEVLRRGHAELVIRIPQGEAIQLDRVGIEPRFPFLAFATGVAGR